MRCCSGLILDWFKRADYKQHYYSELRQAVVREEMMLLRRFKQTYRPECVHTNFIVVIWKDLLKKGLMGDANFLVILHNDVSTPRFYM